MNIKEILPFGCLLVASATLAEPLELKDKTVVSDAAWSYQMNAVGDYLNVTNSSLTATEVTVDIYRVNAFLRKYLPVTIVDSAVTSTTGVISFPVAQYSDHTTDVQVVRSTVSTAKNLKMGRYANGWNHELVRLRAVDSTFAWGGLEVMAGVDAAFSNCTIVGATASAPGTFGRRTAGTLDPSVVTFRDCTITNWAPGLGGATDAATNLCIVAGGTFSVNEFKFGGYSPGRLTLTDGADVRILPYAQSFGNLNGKGSELVVANGAKVRVQRLNNATSGAEVNRTVYFGWTSGYDMTLRIAGGEWTDRSASGLYFGQNGQGRLVVEDGAVEAQTFRAANAPCSTGVITSYIHQVGGRITASVDGAQSKWASVTAGYNESHHGHVILEGGVMQTPQLQGAGGVGYLTANGGTVESWWNIDTSYTFIHGFARAEIGAKGLTVDTTKCSAQIAQDFTNMEGERGVFRKVGAKLLELAPPSKWDVAETRIEEGTLKVVNADETLETALVLTNGATLSMVGAASTLTLDALTVTDGTIELDAGDTVVVPADRVSLVGLKVKYTTTPAAGTESGFLVTTGGELSDASKRALRRTLLGNAIGADENARVIFSYDQATGRTTVSVAVKKDVPELTSKTEFQGGATWSTGTWSAGVPDVTKIAVVADRTVTVDAGATAGALELDGASAQVAGEAPLEIAADKGAAAIYAGCAAATVSAPLLLDSETVIANAPDTVLAVTGDMDGAGYRKTGKGRLELSGSNTFFGRLTQTDGRLQVASAVALNADPARPTLTLTGGTLTFDEPDGEEVRVETPVEVNTPAVRGAAVVECRTPVTFAGWRTTQQGAFIKRGAAPLTIEVGGDIQLNAKSAMTATSYIPLTGFTFDADGTPPDGASQGAGTHYYAGFSVAEGEVAFRAKPGLEARPKITSKCQVLNCLQTTDGTATPTLTLDGVDLDVTSVSYLLNAADLQKSKVISQSPVIRIINGARAYGSELRCKNYGYVGGCQPVWAITNATLQAKYKFWFDWINVPGANQSETAYSIVLAKDAQILSDTGDFLLDGGTRFDCSGGYFGPTDKTQYGALKLPSVTGNSSRASGTFLFRDGAVCRIGSFSFPASDWKPDQAWAVLKFVFDGAEWQYGAGDWTLDASGFAEEYRDHFAVEARGKGLILKPEAGTTFTANWPITGEGPVVVDGPGTVKLGAGATSFAGGAWVRQGTFDASGRTVAIRLEPNAGLPTLKDCAAKGKIQVDMGRAAYEKGATFAVARISGSTPFRFKAVNFADPDLYGYFAVQDGLVTMTVGDKPGLSIIAR